MVVQDTYGIHEVKLPAGDLILYPSSSMLYKLDINIQQLRHSLGDCTEVICLTGHYHNLLRQWNHI